MPAADPPVADVLIVGYGPVGQVLSLLLAQRGWQVVVAEQWPAPYQMPRAVTFDGHAARIIATAGAVDVIARVGEPSADYVIENASGQTLLRIELRQAGRHGWPDSTSMYQPGLEAALAARGASQPGLRVLRGQRVTGLAERELAEDGPVVEAVTTDTSTGLQSVLRARWVVGCDGANSCVRSHIGTPMRDFGFSVDWMACDITPFVPSDFPPSNLQVADPAGPRVAVSAGPGHRRWEFMRLPGEDPEEFGRLASAWRRLARSGVTPANARLDRHAVYTIGARCADRWRSGRILIAGDAAHQMPPFAGQGLCSGIRDAANLAWKLDLVLRGGQDGALLDTYECERKANVEGIIRLSVWLGNLICMTGQAEAAERDADHAPLCQPAWPPAGDTRQPHQRSAVPRAGAGRGPGTPGRCCRRPWSPATAGPAGSTSSPGPASCSWPGRTRPRSLIRTSATSCTAWAPGSSTWLPPGAGRRRGAGFTPPALRSRLSRRRARVPALAGVDAGTGRARATGLLSLRDRTRPGGAGGGGRRPARLPWPGRTETRANRTERRPK